MMTKNLTVPLGDTESPWIDLAEYYASLNAERENWSMALAQLIWPAGYDQAYATIELADDLTGTNASALFDTDGTTIFSQITKPASGVCTMLDPAMFCVVNCARIKLPAAASAEFTFAVRMRRAQ